MLFQYFYKSLLVICEPTFTGNFSDKSVSRNEFQINITNHDKTCISKIELLKGGLFEHLYLN